MLKRSPVAQSRWTGTMILSVVKSTAARVDDVDRGQEWDWLLVRWRAW
jgi:hypothetical protein